LSDLAHPITPSASEPRAEAVTIVVATDDAGMRANLEAGLELGGFALLADKDDATRAVGAVLVHRPRVCLLDVDLPGDVLGCVSSISSERPDTRIAILAKDTANETLPGLVDAGIDGVLLAGDSPGNIAAGINAIAHRIPILPPHLRHRVPAQPWLPDAPPGEVEAVDSHAPAAPARRGPKRRTGNALLYLPRFLHHLRRRRRSNMAFSEAWSSARARMRDYR
jgi:DNA-binding NarL/FixJ family response regulator